tara:strand:- start:146 stop:505 length:360 start_codon:yes stop_codon:yes gene_type:complete
MTKNKQPKTLGPNAKSFQKHIEMGLEAAGVDINDYYPCFMGHKEHRDKVGLGILQVADMPETFVCCFEDGLTFTEGMSMPITDEQPASCLAVLVLTSILSGRPIQLPECPCCAKEANQN